MQQQKTPKASLFLLRPAPAGLFMFPSVLFLLVTMTLLLDMCSLQVSIGTPWQNRRHCCEAAKASAKVLRLCTHSAKRALTFNIALRAFIAAADAA